LVDYFFGERVLSRINVRRTAQISQVRKFSLEEASRSSTIFREELQRDSLGWKNEITFWLGDGVK